MTLDSRYFLMYNAGIVVITIMMIVLAYRRGFVRQLLNIAAFIASIYLSVLCSELLASRISLVDTLFANKIIDFAKIVTGNDTFATIQASTNVVVWFIALLIGLRAFFWFVILLIPKYRKRNVLSFINHFFGMIFGMAKALVFLVLLTVILNIPIFTDGKEFIDTGVLAPVQMVVEKVIDNV